MPSIASDLGYLRAAIPILKEFLLSDEVYWSLGAASPSGEPAYPQLTLGGMLLAQTRLSARHLEHRIGEDASRLSAEAERFRLQMRVRWERKASREFGARIRLWRDFLEEYRSHPGNNRDRYAFEVTRRVMLDLLRPQAGDLPAAQIELLYGLDKLLRAVFLPSRFIWEAELAAGFPEASYWYLYGGLRE